MKRLVRVFLVSAVSTIWLNVGADIIYNQGLVYSGEHPSDPSKTVLYLNLDYNLATELYSGPEYFFEYGSPTKIWGYQSGLGVHSLNGAYEYMEKSTEEVPFWYGSNNAPDGYFSIRFRSEFGSPDYYYGWIRWQGGPWLGDGDGGTFIEYAYNDTPNEHIMIGAVPEPATAMLIAIPTVLLFAYRRYFKYQ